MGAKYTEYFVQLVNARTKQPINDDTGIYCVLTAGSPVLATIYSDETGTAPAFTAANVTSTMTDGKIRFFTASSVTSVDLSIVTANGQAVFVSSLTPSQHRVEIDTEKIRQMMVVPYYNYIPTPYTSASITATASVWGNGFSIPANSVVHDCWLRSSTLGTTALQNVGVSGTPTGLLVGATCSVTGFFVPEELAVSVTLVLSRGALLLATGVTSEFMRRSIGYTAATAIVFGNATVTTLAAHSGWIYITYDKVPV